MLVACEISANSMCTHETTVDSGVSVTVLVVVGAGVVLAVEFVGSANVVWARPPGGTVGRI